MTAKVARKVIKFLAGSTKSIIGGRTITNQNTAAALMPSSPNTCDGTSF